MVTKTEPPSYDSVLLDALHGEFSFSNKQEAEAKIKRRLKRKGLSAYDQQRVDLLRRFKDAVQREIGLQADAATPRFEQSPYYVGRHGKYGDYSDYDIPRLTADMVARFPEIAPQEISWFVRFAVGTYYLL